MTDRKQIALIYGGRGLEHSVSVAGAKNLFPLFDSERYKVIPIHISRSGKAAIASPFSDGEGAKTPISFLTGGNLLTDDGEIISVDCVFPLLHGDFGEDGSVQGLFTSLRTPFVGCDARASAVCLDKAVAKSVAESLGIPTVRWRLLTSERPCLDDFAYPVFIKPDCLGSSYGAGVARSPAEFDRLYAEAYALSGRVLVEEFKSNARELECAFFEAQDERVISSAGEILCDGFYSYDKKYARDGAKVSARADVSREQNERIRRYSEALCSFIGIRHLARVDFFLADGEIYFNEINTMPGMTETSLYLRLVSGEGISPTEAVNRFVSDAISAGAP